MGGLPFTEGHEIFRKTVRDFAEKELFPHQKEWEKGKSFPREIFGRAAELGLFGVVYPEELGGSGGDYWYKVVACEEMIRARMAGMVMDLFAHSDIATPVISEIGSEAQKKEFLVPAIKGEKIGALGITEPGAGSDVANISTTAKKEGSDYVINGAKTFITNGTRADFITLAVRTGDKGYQGISLILFPTDTKGFTAMPIKDKLGNHSSDTAELHFENCRIPARYLLGDENAGFIYIMQNFQGERLVGALMANASAQLAVEDAMAYARQREAFGRPLIKLQVWRHRFADLLSQIEASRCLTYHAVDLFNRKEECVAEVSMAKLISCDLANRIAYDCLQIHGGYGYTEEYDVARYSRDVRLLTIGGGASEIMKEIIAKRFGM